MKRLVYMLVALMAAVAVQAQVIGYRGEEATQPSSVRKVLATERPFTLSADFSQAPGKLLLADKRKSRTLQLTRTDMNGMTLVRGFRTGQNRFLSVADTECHFRPAADRSAAQLSPVLPSDRLSIQDIQASAVRSYADAKEENFFCTQDYTGIGVDYETKSDACWVMNMGVMKQGEEEQNVIENPVPNYFSDRIDSEIYVSYTREGDVITIPAQPVLELEDNGQKLYVIISSMARPDGAIVMTVGADGKLTTHMPETIMYGAWTTDTFDPEYKKVSRGGTYYGFYQYTSNVQYLLPGEQPAPDADDTGFITETEFTTRGKDLDEGRKEWKTCLGSNLSDGVKHPVIRNLLPNVFTEQSMGGYENIDLKYTQEGDIITIPVQTILTGSQDNGNILYVRINSTTEDGAMRIRQEADGHWTVLDNDTLMYSYWDKEIYDPEFLEQEKGGHFIGYAEILAGIKFYLPDDPDTTDDPVPSYEGYTTQRRYNGSGMDDETGSLEKWRAQTGVYVKDGKEHNLFLNLAPIPGAQDYIDVEFTRSGSDIVIMPQLVFIYKKKYYVYLCSYNTDDGSIVLEEDTEGHLKFKTADEMLMYAAFTEDRFDTSFDTFAGALKITTRPRLTLDGEELVPEVIYEPEGLMLHACPSETGYQYVRPLSVIPADVNMVYTNTTQDEVDDWSWEMNMLRYDADKDEATASGATITSNSRDLIFYADHDSIYGSPLLTGSFKGAKGASYQWNDAQGYIPIIYPGGSGSDFTFSDGSHATMSKANPKFGFASFSFMATPGKNTSGYSMSRLISFQGKPACPLYFEGVKMLVTKLEKKADFNAKCQIYEAYVDATGDLSLGDIIAESCTVSGNESTGVTALNFTDFYTYDHYGFTTAASHLFLDKSFAIVISGWDNETFQCVPLGEADYNYVGTSPTFLTLTGDEDIRAFRGFYYHLLVGLTGASYGYLHTSESTNSLLFPATQTSRTIRLEAMNWNTSAEDGVTRQPRLFLDEDSDNPDWLTVSIDQTADDENDGTFGLCFTADAMPQGVLRRTADIKLYQEGARMTVHIVQDSRQRLLMNETGIKDIEDHPQSATPTKFLRDGQILITKKGETYNTNGIRK